MLKTFSFLILKNNNIEDIELTFLMLLFTIQHEILGKNIKIKIKIKIYIKKMYWLKFKRCMKEVYTINSNNIINLFLKLLPMQE